MDIVFLGLCAALALLTGLAAWGCERLARREPWTASNSPPRCSSSGWWAICSGRCCFRRTCH